MPATHLELLLGPSATGGAHPPRPWKQHPCPAPQPPHLSWEHSHATQPPRGRREPAWTRDFPTNIAQTAKPHHGDRSRSVTPACPSLISPAASPNDGDCQEGAGNRTELPHTEIMPGSFRRASLVFAAQERVHGPLSHLPNQVSSRAAPAALREPCAQRNQLRLQPLSSAEPSPR